MEFCEVFSDRIFGTMPRPMTLHGYLVVTDDFSYLISDKESFDYPDPFETILVGTSLSEHLLDVGIPISVGTMIAFCGDAKITGIIERSGIPLMPVAFTEVFNLIFYHDNEEYEINFDSSSIPILT